MSTLADDLLPGAKKIASYVYGVDDKRHQRKIYHKYETREKKTAGRSGRTAKTSCLARVS